MSAIVLFATDATAIHDWERLSELAPVLTVAPSDSATIEPDYVVQVPRIGSLGSKLVALGWQSALGRNMIRITPWDRSRRYWRAVRADETIRTIVESSCALVAADRDAIFAVWQFARRVPRIPAVYGVTPARYLLSAQLTAN